METTQFYNHSLLTAWLRSALLLAGGPDQIKDRPLRAEILFEEELDSAQGDGSGWAYFLTFLM
ncbi:MAG: hypothetical protein DMF61_26845 [Blastocatellia bacterium AA13]|nr:MAG: hypothetical protein DMF61_26845 [Blastocatellia bacterium AA13]